MFFKNLAYRVLPTAVAANPALWEALLQRDGFY
jgi:hypothetical protein